MGEFKFVMPANEYTNVNIMLRGSLLTFFSVFCHCCSTTMLLPLLVSMACNHEKKCIKAVRRQAKCELL